MDNNKLKSMHEQIEKIHKASTDDVNADVLHRFIDEQDQELESLRAQLKTTETERDYQRDLAIYCAEELIKCGNQLKGFEHHEKYVQALADIADALSAPWGGSTDQQINFIVETVKSSLSQLKAAQEQEPVGYVVIGQGISFYKTTLEEAEHQANCLDWRDDKEPEIHPVYRIPPAAKEQQEIWFRRVDLPDYPEGSYLIASYKGAGDVGPLYASPVPAQQSINRQAIIDILVSSCNLSEGFTADLIINAIGAQQSPAVAVPDTVYCSNETTLKPEVKKHLESLIALRAEMQGEESRTQFHAWADEQGFCMDEVWSSVGEPFEDENTQLAWIIWQASRAVIGAQSPCITEQDAREIAASVFNVVGLNTTDMVDAWIEGDGKPLLAKLNGEQK